jgi:hypothetical protein
MKRIIISLLSLTLIVLVIGVNVSAADETPTDGARFEITITNSWGEADNSYIQLDGAVINDLAWSLHGWTARLKADSGVYVEDAWNCYVAVDNGVITVTPADFVNTVPTGGSVVFGLILRNAGTVETAGFNVTLPDGSGYEPPEYAEAGADEQLLKNQIEIIRLLEVSNSVLTNFFYLFIVFLAFKAVVYIFTRVFFGGIN